MVLMNKYFCLLYMWFGLIQTYIRQNLANITVWKMLLFPFCEREANKQTFCCLPFSELHFLICSCTRILLEPPSKDNSIIFCSLEYATKVSIIIGLRLLGPEMFTINIFFRHLVVVTIQFKWNIKVAQQTTKATAKCRYSPTHSQPQHYMEASGQLQSLCQSEHFGEDISRLPAAGNWTTIPVIQPIAYSPYRLRYPRSLRSIH